MRTLRKRFLALMLSLVMALGLLPGTAAASLGQLLGNSPEENEALLSALTELAGPEDAQEFYALLQEYGLLDEDGQFVTDRTIDLDGENYTLEEMEALLADPDTDLAQVAEVDGVPIALGDLATVIAIEREIQSLQETYFSGATFNEEARANVNSLLNQLQTQGLTLSAGTRSAENQIVFDTSDVRVFFADDDCPVYYISTGAVSIPANTILTVKFKLNLSNALKPSNFAPSYFTQGNPVVYLSEDYKNSLATLSDSEVIYLSDAEEGTEYSLSINTGPSGHAGQLYLCLCGPTLQASEALNYDTDFAKYSFGKLWQAVSFYDAQGFLFQDGNDLDDQWTGYFSVEHELPEMPTTYTESSLTYSGGSGQSVNTIRFSLADNSAILPLETTLTYLQRCITDLTNDNALRVHVTANISQTNSDDGTTSRPLITPESVFLGSNSFVDANSLVHSQWPLNLAADKSTDISFDTFSTSTRTTTSGELYSLLTLPGMIICQNENVTWAQIDESGGDFEETYTYYVESYTATTHSSQYALKSETTKPTLTITAPAGTYQSGDVIPITITGNEYIKVDDLNNTKITINNAEYSLSDLHASSSGKYLTLFYEVKEIDAGTLTVGISGESGITDFFGNKANEVNAEDIDGVTLVSPLLKNAVEDFTATYDEDTDQITFSITAKQHEKYQTLYGDFPTKASTPVCCA